ncbi:MAG: dTMP kinase [Candidatus Zixiibacteriota bacterium]|nr:MAG: dTMP kinase [candidate division Zixibacteria bacterium]
MPKPSLRHRGLFVTFEGIDGCGKTTQLKRTAAYLRRQGCKVGILREPGSTRVAEMIRKLLLNRHNHMTDITELLLYEAARADITAHEIRPRLQKGEVVLCDRFFDSTTAYQGYGRGLDIGMVRRLHRVAVDRLIPDLTFVFDLPVKTAFGRRGRQADRLEAQSRAFFNRVRRGYLAIAAKEPRRVKVIDARPDPATVFEQLRPHLERRLARLSR